MRVAVHFPKGHPLARGESEYPGVKPHDGPSVCAYKLGRIEEGVHNAPVGHEPIELGEYVRGLVREAQEEYPDAKVVVERLIDNGDGTSRWIAADQFDPAKHMPAGAGRILNREVSAQASSEAGG